MITRLYENIQQTMASDPEILDLMDLTGAAPVKVIKRFEKRMKPQNLVEEAMPLISFYAVQGGGLQRTNDRVYDAIFMFDVYTNDNVSLAFDIGARLYEIFHGRVLPFQDVENFETLLLSQYETATDTENTFCFTTVLKFSITIER